MKNTRNTIRAWHRTSPCPYCGYRLVSTLEAITQGMRPDKDTE